MARARVLAGPPRAVPDRSRRSGTPKISPRDVQEHAQHSTQAAQGNMHLDVWFRAGRAGKARVEETVKVVPGRPAARARVLAGRAALAAERAAKGGDARPAPPPAAAAASV